MEIIKGAQGSNPFDRFDVYYDQVTNGDPKAANTSEEDRQRSQQQLFALPWLRPDPHAELYRMPFQEILSLLAAIPPGLQARTGTCASPKPDRPPVCPGRVGAVPFSCTVKTRYYWARRFQD
jgi:hypothetical protein